MNMIRFHIFFPKIHQKHQCPFLMVHCDCTFIQKDPHAPNNATHMIESEIYVEGSITAQIMKTISPLCYLFLTSQRTYKRGITCIRVAAFAIHLPLIHSANASDLQNVHQYLRYIWEK